MIWWIAVLAALSGYLIGSISFARIFGNWLLPDEDISHTEVSIPNTEETFAIHSVSAISLAFRKGPRMGCLVSVLDMLKAFLPTLLFLRMVPDGSYHLIAAAAVIAGHNFPIYYGFKGGRGMSSLYGALLVIDWVAIPATTLGAGILGMGLLRDLFLAYTGGIPLLILWLWFRFRTWPYVLFAVAINVFFWIAMWPELQDHLGRTKAAKLRGEKPQVDFRAFSKQWMGRRDESAESMNEPSVSGSDQQD